MASAAGPGQRSTTVCAITSGDAYSRLRRRVATVNSAVVTTSAPIAKRRERGRRAGDRATAATASTAIATTGRYIRRSAPTSVAIGTMLDVGASVMKNHAPRKPTAGARTRATVVATRIAK